MAIPGGGISRVSHGLQTFTLLQNLRQNSMRLFAEQQRLSSGKQLLSVSDDPIAASNIARLQKQRENQNQILTNLRHADGQLSAADSALTDVADLLIQASRIASEQAGSLQSTEERAAQATVVASLIDQLRNIGNQQYQGLFLFGGRGTEQNPFTTQLGRVTFAGDLGSRSTLVGQNMTQPFDVNAADIFNLKGAVVGGLQVFEPQLAADTRISELGGASGAGVRLGRIRVDQTGPALSFEVDFAGAETIGDLVARFNDAAAAAGSAATLGISPADGRALRVSSGGAATIQISDVGQGVAAADLGLRKTAIATDIEGDDLQRRATLTTRLADLTPSGISLPDGVRITNGTVSKTVTFAGATTLQDVLNALNGAGAGIRASINAAGNGIEVQNLVAGSPLVIGENGGVDAATLGIKTLDNTVPVSRLNGLRGIHPVSGSDFRITDANGISFEVDVSSVQIIGDLLHAINAAANNAGSTLFASVSDSGAGLQLVGPAGPGTILVEKLNLSPVAEELGILKTGSATLLNGDDVGAFYQTGVFSALYRLHDALLADNASEITEAGKQINEMQRHLSSVAGQVGARAQALRGRLQQTEDAVTATSVLLSELEDVDFTEAVTRFQEAQTALQASLLAGSRTQYLSLLDFLR